MAHCLAQETDLTCPGCGQRSQADIWLIVDVMERPDLAARIKEGAIHSVTCPHCGHAGEVDAPLLVFNAKLEPPLIFAPAQSTTAEQDEEQVARLVAVLQKQPGTDWRDEWLAQGLLDVQHSMLPVALSDDPEAVLRQIQAQAQLEVERLRQQDPDGYRRLEAAMSQVMEQMPLLESLLAFVAAETLEDSRSSVEQHPELLSVDSGAPLRQLVEIEEDADARHYLQERSALLARCQDVGVAAAFAEKAVASLPGDVPDEIRAAFGVLAAQPREVRTAFSEVIHGISSSEELEAALEQRPELREPLTQAWSAMVGIGSQLPELQALLDELLQLAGSANMPRRVELCERGLAIVRRSTVPHLWATLQFELGNSLAQNPAGDRGQNLERAIAAYKEALTVRTREALPVEWAQTVANLANAYRERIDGDRDENVELAIAACSEALTVLTREALPLDWAQAMMNLANAFSERERANPSESVERAIAAYEQALMILTKEERPREWALIMCNLARAYQRRILGDRAGNLERAIAACSEALTVLTREDLPLEWAATMNNLANAYADRIRGERAENLERAVVACEQALTVRTQQALPLDWAHTVNNLATFYHSRILGDRAQNLERAIAAYEEARTVLTREAFPLVWAMTMTNLATAYSDRICGARAENLEQAIAIYEEALTVLTHEAFPVEWAMTMTLLAIAYSDRIRGERAENLERAIAAHEQALSVRVREALPLDWAMTMMNLANAYFSRVRGERAENLEQAIAAYEQAQTVLTRETLPLEWATTMMNLANAYRDRIHGDWAENLERAIAAYEQSLTVRTQQALPLEWAATMMNLATAYLARIRGERVENVERALATYEKALTVFTREALPLEWANTMMGLANAYSERVRGDRAENVERAIEAYEQALTVQTREALPHDHRSTQHNLGNLCFATGRWAQAIQAYRGALAAAELLYQAAATQEARRAELRVIRDLPVRLAYAMGKDSVISLPEAVMVLERNRARWLSEALALQTDRPLGVPDSTWGEFSVRREAIRRLHAEARLPEETPAKRPFLALADALREAYAALREAVDEVRGHNPNFMPEPTLNEIQAAAKPGCPLVYLAVTSAGAQALVVVPQSSEAKEDPGVWPVWADLTEDELNGLLVQRKDRALNGYLPAQLGLASMDLALEAALPILGERLMRPLADRLRELGARGATLIPTGLLGLLPLHVARYSQDGEAKCLLDEFEVTYVPSALALSAARRTLAARAGAEPVLAGVGNPLDNPNPLGYAYMELEQVSNLYTTTAQSVLYEHDATPEHLVAALPGATHVHLSCHGMFDPKEPLDSHLQLANEEPWTLREILGAEYLSQARLVVLSACQTAITDFANLPDEVIGLPAGFLHAGVPGVVGTLWPVNALSTMLLMVRFYRYHLQGDERTGEGPMAPATALRWAQLWLRDLTTRELAEVFDGFRQEAAGGTRVTYELAREGFRKYALRDPGERPFAAPYYWAPFMFYGC